ncbi:MAG: cyclic di-GMP phosphodiesterase, partial [Thermoanaerobaculia bacterium]|nr:cyclic di-GMP phosphodiesterase [Thermoanaerobaculia bacterium]
MVIPDAAVPPDRDIVLAVDDNEQNLQLLEEYLSTWGYDVVLARDGREALELFPRINPAVIVLDVMMPVMDGYEACGCIKADEIGRTIPILMLTALTGTEDKIKALECGADDFLNKPINREELRTRIRSLARIRNLRKELDSSENIILTLTNALANKDPHSRGHGQRVAAYASRLCEKLGMSREEREIVTKGALLHDVGMIGVPDVLLAKATLTDEEAAQVAAHTRIGASILEPMKTFRPFVPIVRWHHERNDGRGYPDGLAGDAIPLEAQIAGIANRFDEIQHDDDLSEADALALLRAEGREGAFDGELLSFFAAALDEEHPAPVTSRHMRPRPAPVAHVLCVDDNPINRELVAASVEGAGFRVSFAENGAEAVEIIDRDGIDVVLLDLLMPVQDGAETLRLLRADPRHLFLPIIVLTAHGGGSMRQEAIVAGADDFIAYPLNRVELITRIRSLMRIKDFHADLEQTYSVICALALA